MILTEEQRRGLNFVAVANAGGNRPTAEQITEWLRQPVRRPGGRGELITPRTPGMLSSLMSGMKMPNIDKERIFGTPAVYGPSKPAEGYVSHLLRLGWLESAPLGDGLVVTALAKVREWPTDCGGPEPDRRTGPLWFAGDDTNPARRTLFETQGLAMGFVSDLPGWSAYPETDPRARPLPGPLVPGLE